jgi:C4-dicarboxylate-specific signal transduction histidine kinase
MKRISASAVKAASQMPAEEILPTTVQEADSNPARSRALSVSSGDQHAHFETGLAHLARLAALGEMLAGIVHEINQPLFAVQNYARALTIDLTQRNPLDPKKLMASASQIVLETDRASSIVSRLRDFARKTSPCAAQYDVSRLVQEAVDLVLPEANRREIAIELQIEPDVQTIYGDRIQLQQVLVNLLKNACEAIATVGINSGQIVVRVRPEGGRVQFSVSDNGAGLPAVDPSQLFESFFTTKPEGVGIGLAVSRSIVEGAHGRLWAEPNIPHGAVFHFTVSAVPELAHEP